PVTQLVDHAIGQIGFIFLALVREGQDGHTVGLFTPPASTEQSPADGPCGDHRGGCGCCQPLSERTSAGGCLCMLALLRPVFCLGQCRRHRGTGGVAVGAVLGQCLHHHCTD